MPTLLRFGAFRIVIYTDDHGPPHVHVKDGVVKAAIWLHCSEVMCSVRINDGLSRRELSAALRLCVENLVMLCETWRQLHVHAI